MMWPRAFVVGVAFLFGLGCASAYDRAYEEETRRLEVEDQRLQEQDRREAEARRAAQQEAYDEAKRYAAVVYFETGSDVISEDGYRELGWFAQQISGAPANTEILVQGFADATGGDSLNQDLSEQRARAVARHLRSLGIDRERLVVQGFASNFPAADNTEVEGRRNNRRVEVTLR